MVESVFTQLEQVFGAQGLSVGFADRAMGSFAVNGIEPDAIIKSTVEDGRIQVVGELESP